MRLHNYGAGTYATLDGRFLIERQDGETQCEHPLCEQLHERFMSWGDLPGHSVLYVSWHVWDNERNDYASTDSGHFDTKREAVAWLERHLAAQ